MKNRRNYYRVLQVQPDAPVAIIKSSYKTLMRELQHHPDLGGDLWNAQVLNEAYDTLSHPSKREAYDRQLFERYNKKPFQDSFSGTAPLITYYCPFCKRPLARKALPSEMCPTCRSPMASAADETLQQTCRRAIPRIKKSGRFMFYTNWPQKGKSGEIVDLSRNGMRFKCAVKLSEDMLIKVTGGPLRGVAKVRNVHKIVYLGYVSYSVGVEFVSVSFNQSKGGFYSASA